MKRDDIVNRDIDTSTKEEKKKKLNAFSILMQGARSTTPRKGRLKQPEKASARKK